MNLEKKQWVIKIEEWIKNSREKHLELKITGRNFWNIIFALILVSSEEYKN